MSTLVGTGPPARLAGRPTLGLAAVILKARLTGFRNAMRNTKAGRVKAGFTLIAGVIVALVVGFLVNRFTAGVLAITPEVIAEIESSDIGLEAGLDPQLFLDLVPRAILSFSLVLLIISTFSSLLGALYLSDDMPRLLTAPVPARAVFLAKFLEAALPPTMMQTIFALPALVGFGIATDAGALFHVVAIMLFLLLPQLALGLSALVTLALVRVLPARRASEALRVLGAFIGFGIYFGSQTLMQGDDATNLLRGLSRVPALLGGGAGGGADAGAILARPWTWPAESVLAAAAGRPLAAVGWCLGFAALSCAAVMVALLASERLYLDGWAKAEGGRASRRRRSSNELVEKSSGRARAAISRATRRNPTLAIARKDLLLIRRDVRGWSMLIWPIAIGVFWLWQVSTSEGNELLDSGSTMVRAASIATALFAAGGVGHRFALEGISRDSGSIRIAVGAPITGREIALGKVLVAFLLSLTASTLLLGAFALISGIDPQVALLDATIVALALAGQSAIGVAAGAIRPVFDWSDPQKIVGGGVGCVTWIVIAVFSMIIVSVGLGPPLVASLLGAPTWLGLFGPLGALALTSAVVIGCVTWAGERVSRIEL